MTSSTELRALLIGTAKHTPRDGASAGLDGIPQVADNLTDLAVRLAAPHGRCEPDGVEIVQDPISPNTVFDAIRRQPPGGTLLCYFTGHGLDDDGRLCLALPGSIDRDGHRRGSSLPLDLLLEHLLAASRRRTVLILDCCYSGCAFDEPLASDVHVMTAVGRKAKAKFTHDRNTLFTGALLRILTDGIPDGSSRLDLANIFTGLCDAMRDNGDPTVTPHQRAHDSSAGTVIASNPAFRRTLDATSHAARSAHADKVGLAGDPLRAARLFADLVSDIRRSGSTAPEDVFRSRMDTASWTGRAGSPEDAVRLLRDLLADALSGVPAEEIRIAEQSLAYWVSECPAGGVPGSVHPQITR